MQGIGERSRRRIQIVLAIALVVMGVASVLVCCWFLLPRWAPGFVVQHSPWIEPMVRAAANDAEAESVARWRFLEWGRKADPELYACMHAPGLRNTVLKVFPLRVPYSDLSAGLIDDDQAERRIVLVKTFEDQGKRWHLIRCPGVATLEIPDSPSVTFAAIQSVFSDRSRAVVIPHPYEPGPGLALIHLELDCDVSVPYWIIDRFLDLATQREQPSDPIIGSIQITVHRDDPTQEAVMWTSPLPAPADAHVVTIRGTGSDRLHAVVQVDDHKGVIIAGEVDSPQRREGIATILRDALSAYRTTGTMRPHIAIRGDRDALWGDIVAALNAALHERGMRGQEWRTRDPERFPRITLMRQAPPMAGQVGP